MSNFFVTSTGFVKKTFEELKTYWQTSFQSIFGDDIDLDETGPFGQLAALFAKRDADIWDGAEEIYNSRNPNAAEGLSLDNVAAETGVIRQAATSTQVTDVQLFGTEGTVVAAGKLARQSTGDYTTINYTLKIGVTITKTAARKVLLTMDEPGGAGETFTITIDGTPYSYVTIGGDTGTIVAGEIKTLIEAGAFAGTVTQSAGQLTIEYITVDFSISWTANITLDALASGGDFEADTAGAYPLPGNTLDTIVTPVSGWDSVNNPSAGVTGRNTETDSDFRIRRANTLTTGNATDDAIVNAISNRVSGITQVGITSNRTDATVDGIPAHSFEVVVTGGADADIAQQIWDTQPSGIQSHGSTTVIVVDSEGNNQTIKFSRPTPIYIHVKVKRDLFSEETYPATGDTAIKDAIVEWALLNQPIGKDVIRQRLSIPVYEVPGIEDIEISIDGTPLPGDTPTYALANVAIAGREYADFATSRIVVEALTP